jgi:hypothetical protein
MSSLFAGLPLLRGEPGLGSRVIVVGASDSTRSGHTRAYWRDSGKPMEPGSDDSVDVVAPGVGFHFSIDGQNLVNSGTSLAAPYVAGVALLMKSFDPRISMDTVRDYIVQGAGKSGWTSGGYPYLSAYESLKLVAKRPTAPLCGSRVFADSGMVKVLRDSASAGSVESLFSPHGLVWFVNPLHGGKAVYVYSSDSSDFRLFRWNAGAWTQDPAGGSAWTPPPHGSGMVNSWLGYSHEADTVYTVWQEYHQTSADIVVQRQTPSGTGVFQRIAVGASRSPETGACLHRYLGPNDPAAIPADSAHQNAFTRWVAANGYDRRTCDDTTSYNASDYGPTASGWRLRHGATRPWWWRATCPSPSRPRRPPTASTPTR